MAELAEARAFDLEAVRKAWRARLLEVARGELGVKERAGDADNPRILEYQSITTKARAFLRDAVAWCSSFACWCVEQVGLRSTRSSRAKSWETWGEACEPDEADVIVFYRGGIKGRLLGQRHVAFHAHVLLPFSAKHVYVLGGNHQNAVSIEPRPRGLISAARRATEAQLRAWHAAG